MQRTMFKSKIHRATVTQADLHYVGSVTIDQDLLDASDILPGELVSIVDVANGARLETYTIAGERGMLVIGTDHAAENVTGFFTKFGDGGADVLPLAGLNKRQIRQVLEYLGAPEPLITKAPTADLLGENPGRTDEDELGLGYDQLDDYLEGKDVPAEVADNIENRFMRSRHKRTVPVTPADTWWR